MIRSITCPICKQKLPAGTANDSAWAPFCSERCRNVDLYRWGEGRYAITEPLASDEDLAAGPLADPHEDDA